MGWTAHYQLVRETPLSRDELARLAQLVREEQGRPWDGEPFGLVVATSPHPNAVIAKGSQKLAMDPDSDDGPRLGRVLERLAALVPGATVNAIDDVGVLEQRALLDDRDGSWTPILALVPIDTSYPPAIAAVFAAGGPSETQRTDAALVEDLLRLLAKPEGNHEPLHALVAACDPDTVARVGFGRYLSLRKCESRIAIGRALARVRDVPALADLFVTVWSNPVGTYFYGDLPLGQEFGAAAFEAGGTLAAQPVVRDRLIADLDAIEAGDIDDELPCRRAEKAALLLGRSNDPRALRRLAESVRRWRGQKLNNRIRFHVYWPALEALATAASPRWLPTTLLALDGATGRTGSEARAIEHSLAVNLPLAGPILRATLARNIAVQPCLAAIEKAGPAAAAFADLVEPHLASPLWARRRYARSAMAAVHGRSYPHDDDRELRDPEAHVLDPDLDVRHAALHELHGRKDVSLFVALCLAEQINAYLDAAVEFPGLPYSWMDWKGLAPKKVLLARKADRLAWARGDGAKKLGPQRIPPVIAAVADLPPRDVAATYASQRIQLDDATRARLLALEEQAFATA